VKAFSHISASPLSSARWYVVQTQHRSEAQAARELASQAFEIFLPRYQKKCRHARKVTLVTAPLFPGYLFVRLDPGHQRWRSINGTRCVVRVIASQEGPIPVPDALIAMLRKRLDPQGFVVMSLRPDFAPGAAIRIRSGSFADAIGLFDGFRDHDRVAVLLEFLGGKVRVELDEDLVEKAA
jgi:transcriptional antiterminator RfaH